MYSLPRSTLRLNNVLARSTTLPSFWKSTKLISVTPPPSPPKCDQIWQNSPGQNFKGLAKFFLSLFTVWRNFDLPLANF